MLPNMSQNQFKLFNLVYLAKKSIKSLFTSYLCIEEQISSIVLSILGLTVFSDHKTFKCFVLMNILQER